MALLNHRQNKIIKILIENKEKYVTVKKIASSLNVSDKTIYRELKKFDNLNEFKIQKTKGKGLKLLETNISLKNFYLKNNIVIEKYSTIQRRCDIYYNLLITSPKNTTLNLLSEKYYVGQASIVNDIKYIQKYFLYEELFLIKDKNGTRIEGSEKNIRKAIQLLIEKYKIENYTEVSSSLRIDNLTLKELILKFTEKKVKKVEDIIKRTEEKILYKLGDVYYINLCIHILIMLERCEETISVPSIQNIEINDKYLYSIAEDIILQLENEFNLKISKNEIYNIYQYLCSSGIAKLDKNFNKIIRFDNEKFFIEFLELTKNKLNIDITKSENLYSMFRLHIKALLNRVKFNIEISNSLLDEIKENFGELFYKLKYILSELSHQNILKKINDNEIGFIVMYFQVVLENNREKKRILIVCSSGIGISQLLKNRIENKIKSIVIIDTLPNIEIENRELNNIDLIISTIELDEIKIKKPIVYVTALLNDEDIKKINQKLYR